MLVFSTRLPIKNHVTQEDCLKLFTEWVSKSPHYTLAIPETELSSREDFECNKEGTTFSVRHYRNEQTEIAACRLEHKEKDSTWVNDIVFLSENGSKSLLLQLNSHRTEFGKNLPEVKTPYIVRMFIEKEYCKEDAGIPVTDKPLEADGDYYDTCAAVMNGTHTNAMPVVYVSCDRSGKTALNPKELAWQLGGIAHVFVEKSYETAKRLQADTNGNNAYQKYVGIYFPGTAYCQKHALGYYKDEQEMICAVVRAVRKELVSCLDSSVYNWNQIITLQSRQKVSELQNMSAKDKALLNEYMDTFDIENGTLREQIEQLNHEVYSLRAQLDTYKSRMHGAGTECFYQSGKERELYHGEKSDLLYYILSQAKDRYPSVSRGHTLIQSLLEANPKVGECEQVMEALREVFGSDRKMTGADKVRLKSAGFHIEEDGAHYKLIFHDPRYTFSAPKTPSDFRNGKNMFSNISNVINIERKI